jgi:hypothetical protein
VKAHLTGLVGFGQGTKFYISIGYGDGAKGCKLWDPIV